MILIGFCCSCRRPRHVRGVRGIVDFSFPLIFNSFWYWCNVDLLEYLSSCCQKLDLHHWYLRLLFPTFMSVQFILNLENFSGFLLGRVVSILQDKTQTDSRLSLLTLNFLSWLFTQECRHATLPTPPDVTGYLTERLDTNSPEGTHLNYLVIFFVSILHLATCVFCDRVWRSVRSGDGRCFVSGDDQEIGRTSCRERV